MHITSISNNSPAFGSLANPITPFKIKTTLGTLNVKEITYKNFTNDKVANDIIEFCYRNFGADTNDPFWLSYNDPSKKKFWKKIVSDTGSTLAEQIKSQDETLTVLVAQDKNEQIQGACYAFGLTTPPNQKVYYVEDLAVNPQYRGQNIGKILMEKTMDSVKNTFADIFLIGENLAKGFYTKLGFKDLDPGKPSQKKVIDSIAQSRDDYPAYVSFMTKALQPDKPRWYDNPNTNIPNNF